MFRQIVFPPLEKPPVPPPSETNEDDEAHELILGLNYWFEYGADYVEWMIRCPLCGKKYVYARMKMNTNLDIIYARIAQKEKHFFNSWVMSCPNKLDHDEDLWKRSLK